MSELERGYARIDLEAIDYNIDSMQKLLEKGTKIICVVKANGYGHGAVRIAMELEDKECIWGYATATAVEAMILRNNGIKKPILILGFVFPESYVEMIENEVRFSVFTKEMLQGIANIASILKKKAYVHIKVDTGMSRIGLNTKEEGLNIAEAIVKNRHVVTEGIFTHFARADEYDKKSAMKQLSTFENFVDTLEKRTGVHIPMHHCSNSAGIIEFSEQNRKMDAVRAGITLYGLWPSDEVSKEKISLKPALSFFTRITYLKTLDAGIEISYGGIYTTTKETRIATIPIGYADGYPRSLSNKGYVLIRGKRAPIVGRICMDQFMVDVTDIPECKQYDIVTLIGTDGDETITMEELGELSGKFNYEFVCGIADRIPRIYH